eukprot:GGOE01026877.1.p3 GENE.GGOE01026877.1~~GGOE01026877.1.p3  ORF type:complete len:135 (+),score=20.44 GGOE01026877.1:37-405(+)
MSPSAARLQRAFAVEASALAALQREHVKSLMSAVSPPEHQWPSSPSPVQSKASSTSHEAYFALLRLQCPTETAKTTPADPQPLPQAEAAPVVVSSPTPTVSAMAGGWSPFDGPQWLCPAIQW